MRDAHDLPSLRCFSSESPLAALASAAGSSQVSPLPGPPWYAPQCASPWVCEHVCACVGWASSLSRPAWQPAFPRAFARMCKEDVMLRCVCSYILATHRSYVPLSASASLCVETISILLLSAVAPLRWRRERVCERETGRALSLLSLLLSGSGNPPPCPPTLTYFSQGV